MTHARLALHAALAALALAAGCNALGDEPALCASDATFFADHVWAPVLAQRCVTCHRAEGLAKGTRMVLKGEGEPDYLEHNMEVTRAIAREREGDTSLLLLKPTAEHPAGHQGGMVLARDTPEFAALEQWVARATGVYDCDGEADEALTCDASGAGARRIRRLDHREYLRSAEALVGAPVELPVTFAPDNVVDGYTNNAAALKVTGLLAEQYREAAEALADVLVADLAALVPCDPASGDAACARAFLADFGRRAFRRPLSAAELDRYAGLHAEVAAEDGFAEGLRWTIAALLQAPGFVYRTELGAATGDGAYALTPHELASELSYLIVGGPPDAELAALADDGSLAELEVLQAEAERLLADPRAEENVLRFFDEWLHLDRLPLVTRDATLFPELTPEIRAAMTGETHRFVAALFAGGGTLADLLTASYSYMTPELAGYYGEAAGAGEADPQGFRRVDRAHGAGAGILAQGALLTTHALPTSSSPIHRGKLIRERLLCQHMPPPPPSIDASPPPVDPALSTRERYAQHSEDPACSGCHQLIDPIGFAFEHFDAAGRFRQTDGAHAIDDSGEIKHSAGTDASFMGIGGLASALAGSEEVRACYVDQWSRFALGSARPGDLACVEDELGAAFAAAEGRLDSLVLALVSAPSFRLRVGELAELPDDPGDTTGDTGDTSDTSDTSGGSTGGGSTGEDSGGGEDAPPGIEFERKVDSMWPAGECDTVTVTNVSDAPITWYVTLELGGTLVNFWNAKQTPMGAATRFEGETYNATVEPQQSTSFGFCLEY